MSEKKPNSKIEYSATQFYDDIKKELEKIAPKEFISVRYGITLETLSLLLGQGKRHVSNKKQDKTQIALDLLDEYQLFLKARLSLWKKDIFNSNKLKVFEKIEVNIQSILESYQNQNKLKIYARGISSVFDNHPDLKIDYFIEINSKSKAYWLGWLFAEAWISKYGVSAAGKKPLYRFGVACSNKDTLLIKKFAEEGLSKYEKPKIWEFREELPLTTVGKVLKRELRDESK